MRASLLVSIAAGLVALSAQPVPAGIPPVPSTFYWGVSTSGFQSEGSAPDSNWSRYAKAPGKDPYGNSIDFRHRYPEDIQRAKALGVNVFRFSVEWARIQPAPGRWDDGELAYYDDVVRKIKAAGMRPMITLDHWVIPGWVVDQQGWFNQKTVTDWLANARKVVQRYHGQGAIWITINEPLFYISRELPTAPGGALANQVLTDHMVQAHREAYRMIHQLDPGTLVTSNVAFVPGSNVLADGAFFDRIADTVDFVGIDYYYGLSVDNLTVLTSGVLEEPWKIDPQPDGLYFALRQYARRYPRLPLYVVENGMPTDDGKPRDDGYTRSQNLRDHIYWVQRAIADGMHVIGYNYWSLTDNYEWGSYRPRFGLYTVDVRTDPTLTRRPTDAVASFHDLIAAHGVPAQYTPVRKPGFCSLVDPPFSCLFPPR